MAAIVLRRRTRPASVEHRARRHLPRRLSMVGRVLAVLATVVLLVPGLSACTALSTPRPTADASGDGQAAQDLSQPTGAAESVASTSQVPVYWLGGTSDGTYLFREYRLLPAAGDSVSTAVSAMMSARPLDPDYYTPWKPASRVGSAIGDNNTVTVDVSSDAFGAQLGPEEAELAIQQLVYTATGAAANAGLIPTDQQSRVIILVDGHTGYRAFGQITLGDPMSRQTERAAPIWVIDPQDGTVVTGSTVRAAGRVTSVVHRVSWEIGRATDDGKDGYRRYRTGTSKLQSDSSNGGSFALEQQLPPGNYRVTFFEPGDGGAQRWADSKTITMR
ncbi:GerMN domain-containing protein [Tersicoccus sp. MR15.9]|uniref:GerMN domain-containing protein n=1 Tax=Tersicoccus mangrovi TaxID=3121635 RepID=UPI002FE5CC0A